MDLLYILDLLGVAIFAVSGIQIAGEIKMDPWGAFVLGASVGIGGGTIRDLVLGNTPVFWLLDANYILVIIFTTFIVMSVNIFKISLPKNFLPIADAAGLALFTVIGIDKALELGLSPIICVAMGVLTGTGGGIIRDVLANRVPMVFRREIYATTSIIGGIFYIKVLNYSDYENLAIYLSVLVTFSLRCLVIRKSIKLPPFTINKF